MKLNGENRLDNLSNLGALLREVESEHVDNSDGRALDAREAIVSALPTYRASRYEFGRLLAAYKAFFTEDRGWMEAAKAIAGALGCDERTIRRIVEDYRHAAQFPPEIAEELGVQGIDAAAKKTAPHISNLLTLPVSGARSNLKAVVTAAVNKMKAVKAEKRAKTTTKPSESTRASGDTVIEIKTSAERLRCDIRSKLRATLANVPQDRKLAELIDALQEEMYEAWGIQDPLDITLTPVPSVFTLDGRRKLESVA